MNVIISNPQNMTVEEGVTLHTFFTYLGNMIETLSGFSVGLVEVNVSHTKVQHIYLYTLHQQLLQ